MSKKLRDIKKRKTGMETSPRNTLKDSADVNCAHRPKLVAVSVDTLQTVQRVCHAILALLHTSLKEVHSTNSAEVVHWQPKTV